MISTSATKRSVRRLSPRSTVPKFMKPTDCSVSSMLCPLRTERGYPPRSAPKFGCAGQVQRRQDLPNCKNFRQDLTTMLKITVDNILTKHELQVRQPVVFVTSGCSDVVKLEGTPKGVGGVRDNHALRSTSGRATLTGYKSFCVPT